MKKFKFTLQTVHHVREMREEKEQMILMRMQHDVHQAAEQVREIERLRQQAIENYTARIRAGERLDAFDLEACSNHISTLDRFRREAQTILEQTKLIAQSQSLNVAAAGRAVKITEKLRETQQTRYKLESAKVEQTALDEIVSANFARQMS